jgi:hypothetical protein
MEKANGGGGATISVISFTTVLAASVQLKADTGIGKEVTVPPNKIPYEEEFYLLLLTRSGSALRMVKTRRRKGN